MLSACPLLKVVCLQRKHCHAYLKPASMPFQPALSLEKSLKDSWPIKHNFIFSPQIICPSVACWLSTELEKYVCVRACMCEHVLFTSCFALWSNVGSVNTLFLACMRIQLSSLSRSQLGSQTGRLQAAPMGKVCCLCAHKHCHSVKLPSSSKGYRVIRYTGEINSSAPEKSRTQLPHLLVHITHSLPLWWGII